MVTQGAKHRPGPSSVLGGSLGPAPPDGQGLLAGDLSCTLASPRPVSPTLFWCKAPGSGDFGSSSCFQARGRGGISVSRDAQTLFSKGGHRPVTGLGTSSETALQVGREPGASQAGGGALPELRDWPAGTPGPPCPRALLSAFSRRPWRLFSGPHGPCLGTRRRVPPHQEAPSSALPAATFRTCPGGQWACGLGERGRMGDAGNGTGGAGGGGILGAPPGWDRCGLPAARGTGAGAHQHGRRPSQPPPHPAGLHWFSLVFSVGTAPEAASASCFPHAVGPIPAPALGLPWFVGHRWQCQPREPCEVTPSPGSALPGPALKYVVPCTDLKPRPPGMEARGPVPALTLATWASASPAANQPPRPQGLLCL